jgi:NAD(P)H-dependent nitrite reductase small subunit
MGESEKGLGFVRAARAEELENGRGRTVQAAGHWLAVFRIDDEFYAIGNACPHMAGPLGAGRIEGHVVVCPLHYWRIDVRTGASPTNAHVRVPVYEVRVDDGWVCVRL